MIGPPIILYTQDDTWRRRMQALLEPITAVRDADSPAAAIQALSPAEPAVLWLDVRAERARDILCHAVRVNPAAPVVALGTPRSDPLREAERLGAFATEDSAASRDRLQGLASQAVRHAQALAELCALRERQEPTAVSPGNPGPARATAAEAAAQMISAAAAYRDDPPALFQRIVEAVAHGAGVLRCALFAQRRAGEPFRCLAVWNGSDALRALEYPPEHPLPGWLEAHPQILLPQAAADRSRAAMSAFSPQVFQDTMADALLPLLGRKRLLGWAALGRRLSGAPFRPEDAEALLPLIRAAASALDTAFDYEDLAAQAAAPRALLGALPVGLLAFDAAGALRWINPAAANLLAGNSALRRGQPVEACASPLADAVRRALAGEVRIAPVEWPAPDRGRILRGRVTRLPAESSEWAALAMIEDASETAAEEGPNETTLWAGLADTLSHHIRNPLVAIKTLTQLLPERHADAAFREEFQALVSRELDRLQSVLDRIERFARPPPPAFKALDIRKTVQKGLNLALVRQPENPIRFEIAADDGLPPVEGDDALLSECFAHLLRNAMEAVFKAPQPRITIRARRAHDPRTGEAVAVTIADNGPGIPAAVRAKIFRPFSASSAQGLGLGLPWAKRVVAQHRGALHIETGEGGTSVTVTLPVQKAVPEK